MNSEQKATSQEVRNTPFRKLRQQCRLIDGLRFRVAVFVKCPLKIDVGYLETKIFIVFEDHPAISKHVQIFYEDCRKRAKSVK